MWTPVRNSFTAHCPGIQILYDQFHVIRHLLGSLNEVRKAEFRRLLPRPAGRVILLSRQALTELLAANRRLLKAHLLKESFDHLWSYTSTTWANKFFQAWVDQLKWSRLKPYHRVVKMIENHLDGVLAYCDKPVSLGFIESANGKARNVIRMAYGYRDKAYMKLKIIQAATLG